MATLQVTILPRPVVQTVLRTGAPGRQGDPGVQGPAGSDASVTTANITTALGYKPASPSQSLAFAIAL